MPRKARLIIPGEIHHVMARGIDGHAIFAYSSDKERFVSLLGKYLGNSGCLCYAWAVMDNHYHLLLRPLDLDLTIIMRRLNSAYARYYNLTYSRKGYVFQDRYKSLATQEYWYFRELIRYIHLNPIRASIISSMKELDQYEWTGHKTIINEKRHDWIAVREVLSKFGKTIKDARISYKKHIEAGIGLVENGWSFPSESENEKDSDERVAGEASFVKTAVKKIERELQKKREMVQNRKSLDALANEVCENYGITLNALLSRGRLDNRSRARKKFCGDAVKLYGYSGKEVAAYMGVNPGCVSRMVYRIQCD
ncbi:MAG: hypothetical protein GF401_01980 [Chitinivibrionales bacterium]|nr:hypothetical protein [Chitinivibrionales bacterium]